jgi:hypothetical protein
MRGDGQLLCRACHGAGEKVELARAWAVHASRAARMCSRGRDVSAGRERGGGEGQGSGTQPWEAMARAHWGRKKKGRERRLLSLL